MGRFLFDLPEDWAIQSRQAGTVHVVGLDGIPWPCKVNLEGRTLSIQRNRDGSGHVFVAYPFTKYGELVVSTGTLLENTEPYCLVTELARGTANRLRNQISIWQEGGLKITEEIQKTTALATKLLSAAIMESDKNQQVVTARSAIDSAMDAIFSLSQEFSAQVVPVRKSQSDTTFWLATGTGRGDQFQPSLAAGFADLVEVPVEQSGAIPDKSTILGPFLNAAPNAMPTDLVALDDFAARKASTLATAREVLKEVPDSVKLVHAVSGLNGTGHRYLSYPQQLQLTVDLIQAIEESTSDLPLMISFDCPWAERLAWSVGGTHPLQIADSLLRRGLRISMLGLDINLDYWPGGSVVRDPLQWIELIDIWSQLGLPLVLCLRTPTGEQPYHDPEDTKVGPINSPRSLMSDEQRIQFLETVIPMMIARPTVHGVIWRQWDENDGDIFPNGGLVDADGNSKPLLDFWDRIRTQLVSDE